MTKRWWDIFLKSCIDFPCYMNHYNESHMCISHFAGILAACSMPAQANTSKSAATSLWKELHRYLPSMNWHLCLLRIYLAFSSVYKWTRNYPLTFSVHLLCCILFGLFLCFYIYINISNQIFHTHPLFFSCNFAFIFYFSFLWLTSFSLHCRFWKQWEICQERM